MRRQFPLLGGLSLLVSAVLAGCAPQMPFYFHEDKGGELSHYLGVATEIEVPDAKECRLSEVEGAIRPLSLCNSEAKEIWDLHLEDAVRNALENSKVMRSIGGSVTGAPTFLTQSPDSVSTIYDPALVESNARTGVEAALAAFDAQWTTNVFWERNRNPQNVAFEPLDLEQDTAQFQTTVTKTSATGGVYSVQHTIGYNFVPNNALYEAPLPLAADWTTNLQIQVAQPLLQGAGVCFNEIAGPGAVPGINNGVRIARLNTDIALAQFETSVRNLVSDVEIAYWELYFAYRNLDAVVGGRNSALQTWRKVHELYVVGARGGEADKEAQAREQYFLFRSSVETALTSLYATESKLRYIMGLAATDGRLIRPADEPTTAKVCFDWADTHAEALCRSVELRQERWRVKQRELELIAAKNYLLPRLDAIARYQWAGQGENLTGSPDADTANPGFGSAYADMLHGDFQSWHLGLQATVPIGFRKEMSGVRYAQMAIARERAKLQEEELEVSHQVAYAIRDLESGLCIAQTNFNRRVAAQREVDAVHAAYETGTVTFDVLLEAQRTLADAESSYYRSLVNYNEAIAQVHYRKGSLLEYNGVYLAEGPWPGKAYFDARRRARARDAAHYLNYGFTQPSVMSRGPLNQWANAGAPQAAGVSGVPLVPLAPGANPAGQPETVPTPQPNGNNQPNESTKPADPTQAAPPQADVDPRADRRKNNDLGSLDLNGLGTHEPLANPSTAETDRSASGWQGVQY
jgi:outer membrane protein TolC